MDGYIGGLSARAIGARIGATAVEVNRLLKDQGFLDGEPGAYYLTPKGEEFGIQRSHDNGYGGVAYRGWETTHFDPAITSALDVTPEALAKARKDIAARAAALSAERKAAQLEADLRFHALQSAKKATEVEYQIDTRKVLIVIGGAVIIAGISYAVYKGVQYRKRKKSAPAE